MHAITKHYGFEEAIKLAITAGVDIMTFSNNIAGSDERTVDKVHGIIRKFVESGVITKERIDQSFDRIMIVKRQLQKNDLAAHYKQQIAELEHEVATSNNALEKLRVEQKELQPKQKELPVPAEKQKRKKKRNKKYFGWSHLLYKMAGEHTFRLLSVFPTVEHCFLTN